MFKASILTALGDIVLLHKNVLTALWIAALKLTAFFGLYVDSSSESWGWFRNALYCCMLSFVGLSVFVIFLLLLTSNIKIILSIDI